MRCWESGEPFQQVLAADEEIGAQLSADDLADCFDVDKVLHHVDTIFMRALGASAETRPDPAGHSAVEQGQETTK